MTQLERRGRTSRIGVVAVGLFLTAGGSVAAQSTPPDDSLPTLDEILDRYVTAVGGREALGRLDTRTMSGREIDDRSDLGEPQVKALQAVAVFPDRWLITFSDSLVERQGCDGQVVWARAGDAPARTQEESVRNKMSFLLDPRGSIRLEDYFPGMHVVGRETRYGHDVYVVNSDLHPAHNALSFDVESGLLVQIGWFWTLEDYRDFQGVKVPMRVAESRKGGSTTWIFEDVTHNTPVALEVFAVSGR
ncbi:MAG: hypothetical protein PVJ04_13190 [Gemmatimonadota bacterium]|jgi:hypothetical protein